MKKNCLVIGDLNVDLVVADINGPLEKGSEVTARNHFLDIGGSGGVFAAVLSELGIKTYIISKISNDFFGNYLIKRLKNHGAGTDKILVEEGKDTGVTLSLSYTEDKIQISSVEMVKKFNIGDIIFEGLENIKHVHFTSYYMMDGLQGPYDEIIFFGCGTDYNLCQSASFFTKSLLNNCTCSALPPSELLINSGTYLKENKKYLVIGFSRSGETTESIEVVERLKEKINVTLYIFSAVKNSKIIDLTKNHFICRGAVEKSVAMTKAYTSFLLAYCVILSRFLGREDILIEFEHLIKYLKSNMNILFDKLDSYLENIQFNTFFALGSGFDYGIAVEADLKMKEMSRTQAYSYYLHEFNHGPKTMVGSESLIFILTLNKGLFKVEKVLEDIISLDSKVLIVSGDDFTNKKNENVHFLLEDLDFKFDMVKSFINIPIFQMLAYIQASKKNLNPDKPRNLNFTTRI